MTVDWEPPLVSFFQCERHSNCCIVRAFSHQDLGFISMERVVMGDMYRYHQ